MDNLAALLQQALDFRYAAMPGFNLQPPHYAAYRLFNGYLEGFPGLAVDLYGRTLVIFPPETIEPGLLDSLQAFYRGQLPWLQCVVLKPRSSQGGSQVLSGGEPDNKINENGVWYALDLLRHQDATFYLDTRSLRVWAAENLAGKTVLNTFAYTGSLGAAAARHAARVIQTDLNITFLEIARRTYGLNGFRVNHNDFLTGDFFKVVNRFKLSNALFDCILLDPPFFSSTQASRFDLNQDFHRLVNKVRPLVAHNGLLVAVNNAIFVSGAAFMHELEQLCAGGFMQIETILPVSPDYTGSGSAASLPADPAPFNHSTKIAILRLTRKDQRSASLPD